MMAAWFIVHLTGTYREEFNGLPAVIRNTGFVPSGPDDATPEGLETLSKLDFGHVACKRAVG